MVKAQAKRIKLTFSNSFGECRVWGDRSLLTRILSNLLDNSIRHTPQGRTISVLSEIKPSTSSLLISIKDSGNGISKEHQKKIFERFEQLHLVREGRSGSCGLGLTFCKMAVEAHGDGIWVEGETEGAGSTFCFDLPL